MKFRLTTEHVYPWPVVCEVPDPDDAGNIVEQKFTVTFRAMPKSEGEALEEEIAALPPKQQSARQDDVLRRVVIGWNGDVIGDDKKAIPFSAEALEQAMQFSWFRIGCYRAYRQSLQGEAAKKGN
jgi:hypothetical protein